MVGEDPIVKQPAETDDAASMKIHSRFHPNKEIIDPRSFRFLFRLVFASVSTRVVNNMDAKAHPPSQQGKIL
jgi:hypothetical protein